MSESTTAQKPIIGRLEEIKSVLAKIIERSTGLAEFLFKDVPKQEPQGVGKLGGAVGRLDGTVAFIRSQCDEIECQMTFIQDALTGIFGRKMDPPPIKQP